MISLILLASGFGRRFGSNKLMAEIDGKPMYLHTLERLHKIYASEEINESVQVFVVSQYEEILEAANKMGVHAVFNAEAEEGIAASVRHGVHSAEGSEWYFFFTADQPYLREDTIISFVKAVISQEKSMASVHSQNVPGSPTAFYKTWEVQLLELVGDVGGRRLMKQHPEDVFWYEISKDEIDDIDFAN